MELKLKNRQAVYADMWDYDFDREWEAFEELDNANAGLAAACEECPFSHECMSYGMWYDCPIWSSCAGPELEYGDGKIEQIWDIEEDDFEVDITFEEYEELIASK